MNAPERPFRTKGHGYTPYTHTKNALLHEADLKCTYARLRCRPPATRGGGLWRRRSCSVITRGNGISCNYPAITHAAFCCWVIRRLYWLCGSFFGWSKPGSQSLTRTVPKITYDASDRKTTGSPPRRARNLFSDLLLVQSTRTQPEATDRHRQTPLRAHPNTPQNRLFVAGGSTTAPLARGRSEHIFLHRIEIFFSKKIIWRYLHEQAHMLVKGICC